jgi:molecular chaperone DnaK (HSP70)
MICEATLSDAGLTPDDIEEIILVGGSTRIPSVRDCIKRVFGKAPVYPENVDEMVALGAALYAAHKSDKSELNATQKQSLKKIKVKEICNHYFGTIAISYNENQEKDELSNTILINKGDKIPCSVTEEFSTRYDGQDAVKATVTQSSSDESDPNFVQIVWEGELTLPPDRPKGQVINITYSYDENQIMHCEFVDAKTKTKVEVNLSMGSEDTDDGNDIDRFLVD